MEYTKDIVLNMNYGKAKSKTHEIKFINKFINLVKKNKFISIVILASFIFIGIDFVLLSNFFSILEKL